jgi:hypothetical protein
MWPISVSPPKCYIYLSFCPIRPVTYSARHNLIDLNIPAVFHEFRIYVNYSKVHFDHLAVMWPSNRLLTLLMVLTAQFDRLCSRL